MAEKRKTFLGAEEDDDDAGGFGPQGSVFLPGDRAKGAKPRVQLPPAAQGPDPEKLAAERAREKAWEGFKGFEPMNIAAERAKHARKVEAWQDYLRTGDWRDPSPSMLPGEGIGYHLPEDPGPEPQFNLEGELFGHLAKRAGVESPEKARELYHSYIGRAGGITNPGLGQTLPVDMLLQDPQYAGKFGPEIHSWWATESAPWREYAEKWPRMNKNSFLSQFMPLFSVIAPFITGALGALFASASAQTLSPLQAAIEAAPAGAITKGLSILDAPMASQFGLPLDVLGAAPAVQYAPLMLGAPGVNVSPGQAASAPGGFTPERGTGLFDQLLQAYDVFGNLRSAFGGGEIPDQGAGSTARDAGVGTLGAPASGRDERQQPQRQPGQSPDREVRAAGGGAPAPSATATFLAGKKPLDPAELLKLGRTFLLGR